MAGAPRRTRATSIALRAMSLGALVAASLLVASCGSVGADPAEGVDTDRGGVSFVPANSLYVAYLSLRPKDLDRSLETLDRVPAWGLAEAELPADDGRGLIAWAVGELLELDPATEKVSYSRDVRPWLGPTGGGAMRMGPEALTEGGEPDFMLWLDSRDDDKAREFLRQVADDADVKEVDGVDVHEITEDLVAFVHDGALVAAPSHAAAAELLGAHSEQGDELLVSDETARAMLDDPDREEQLMLLQDNHASLDMVGSFSEAPDTSSREKANLRKLEEFLGRDSVREAIPRYSTNAAGIDEVGLWLDGAWSDAAERHVTDARDWVERLPADATVASAGPTRFAFLEQVPGIWKDARDVWDLELDELAAECPRQERQLCELGVSLAKATLEGDALERYGELAGAQGLSANAMTLDVRRRPARRGSEAPIVVRLGSQVVTRSEDARGMLEIGTDSVKELSGALRPYGVQVRTEQDGEDTVTSIALRGEAAAVVGDALKAIGSHVEFDGLDSLLTSRGLRSASRVVDDTLSVAAYPATDVVEAEQLARGEADSPLGEDADYRRDVKAAAVPDELSTFGRLDLAGLVDSLLVVAEAPQLRPTVQNNLDHVGSILFWSDRRGPDDSIGVSRVVVPIHD